MEIYESTDHASGEFAVRISGDMDHARGESEGQRHGTRAL